MRKYVTQKIIEDLNRAIEITANMPFTVHNIYRLMQAIVQTHGDRMQQTLVTAFEHICSFSAENSTAGEGWKTNSDYMINRRFIVPYMVDSYYVHSWSNCYVHPSAYNGGRIDDVVKALCYLTGKNYDELPYLGSFCEKARPAYGQWYDWVGCKKDEKGKPIGEEWGFFRIRGYKKGTMHFEFIDEDVWYKFNQAVAKIKGWQLPKQHVKNNNHKSQKK